MSLLAEQYSTQFKVFRLEELSGALSCLNSQSLLHFKSGFIRKPKHFTCLVDLLSVRPN